MVGEWEVCGDEGFRRSALGGRGWEVDVREGVVRCAGDGGHF